MAPLELSIATVSERVTYSLLSKGQTVRMVPHFMLFNVIKASMIDVEQVQ